MNNDVYPLLQTKFHPPPVPTDMVPREYLTAWLNERPQRPLTLVSAPAGYGKSTLISSWLETLECPFAWISLDEGENTMTVFLSYLVAAVHSMYPSSLSETQSMLDAPELPPKTVLGTNLVNELDSIQEEYVLILDDLHNIHNLEIHDLLDSLLIHPPSNMHLVICTRMDPPFALDSMRAQNQIKEIRGQDLRFSRSESSKLFLFMLGIPLDAQIEEQIDKRYEGWVTGLRLSALAMRHRVEIGQIFNELPGINRFITDYLMSEILSKQAASLSDRLLKTSILERFNAGLCDAVCWIENGKKSHSRHGYDGIDLHGEIFIEWLRKTNLFVIPLDDEGEWYRYHHLFRDFLQGELERRSDAKEISDLHARASSWYSNAGMVEKALHHALSAGDEKKAVELVSRHRYALMNEARWSRLKRWLDLFPPETVERYPQLLILDMWLIYHRGHYNELGPALTRLSAALNQTKMDDGQFQHLQGEMSAVYSLLSYLSSDPIATIKAATQSIETTPEEAWFIRILPRMCLAGAHQMNGDLGSAYTSFYDGINQEKTISPLLKSSMLATLCHLYWIAADLSGLAQTARQAMHFSEKANSPAFNAWSHYHLGRVDYQQNDLTSAEVHFSSVTDKPYLAYGQCYAQSACGLAMTYQAQGQQEAAREVLEQAASNLIETGNTTLLFLVQACQSELMLMQKDEGAASKWADRIHPLPPFRPEWGIFSPHLTLAKTYLAQNTPSSLKRGKELLDELQAYFEGVHNTRFLIETLLAQAQFHQLEGNGGEASAALEEAIKLAEPGGFIRVFADQDPLMADMLHGLSSKNKHKTYIREILSVFPTGAAAQAQLDLADPLTAREEEGLRLLLERLSNREIAER